MVKEGLFPAVAALREGKIDVAKQMQEQFQVLVPAVWDHINALRKLQVDEAKKRIRGNRAPVICVLRGSTFVAHRAGRHWSAVLGWLVH